VVSLGICCGVGPRRKPEEIIVKIRSTLKQLGDLAVREIGFCVGIHWRSVTGSRVPKGMISAHCRLAYVLFSGSFPAGRFHALLHHKGIDCLPYEHIRFVSVAHQQRTIVGAAVVAVISPDSANATGFIAAPAHSAQPGYQRYFREQAQRTHSAPAWWEGELGDEIDDDRFAQQALQPGRDYAERQADEALERELDRLEAAYNEKLWWYGVPGRRSKYPPKLGSVRELFAYARKQELTPEEFARRNRERQAEHWLNEQRGRDRQHQQELDADQAEIATAIHTPRPGVAHDADQDWLVTEEALKARKGMKYLYRAAAPRPRRAHKA